MRPIQFVLLLLLLFFVPSCVLPLTPALPATKAAQQYPLTPGLDDEAQGANRTMLEQGTVIQEIDIDGTVFVVRQLGSVIAFYNDKDHLLVMAMSAQEKPLPAPFELLGAPILRTEQYQVDGEEYTLQIRGVMGEWAILVLMDTKRRVIFTMSSPAGWLHPRSWA